VDALISYLFKNGGLIQVVVLIVPGFIAWQTYQWRRPQGEQKAADAFVSILTFSVLTRLIWFPANWSSWPTTWTQALSLSLQVFVTPVVVALVFQAVLDYSASRYWITSTFPRAWDFIFNGLALRTEGIGSNGLFMIITLNNGDKVAGVYAEPGIASLWPYDRDLLLGQAWELDNGAPARAVKGSIGVYVAADTIQTIEVFDYSVVVESVIPSEREKDG
jgi:hypothetical protein